MWFSGFANFTSKMKKILIITYYWPPSGGGGVQRWLKFVKYLPASRIKPVVVCPKNPEYPVIDESLLDDIPEEAEIVRLPIWEPYWIFKKITGRKKEEKVNAGLLFDEKKQTLVEKFSLWFRGNFLIPDPRRFWVRPTVKRLIKLIPQIKPEAVITTGPPHSVHLIGYHLKQKLNIPWIADLRDPWSTFDIYDKFYPTKWARNQQKKLEKKTLSGADKILTVSPSWAAELQNSLKKEVVFIPNGYDEKDLNQESTANPDNFLINYVGLINSFRNQSVFWESLNELCAENETFNKKLKIQFVGIYDDRINESFEKYKNLAGKLRFSGYIPHSEVKFRYAESDCLLLLQNRSDTSKGHIPGKVFEYLASCKPILALANTKSDIEKIIKDCKAGIVCHFDDKESIKKGITSIFNKEAFHHDIEKINSFSRQKLTIKLTETVIGAINKSVYRLGREKLEKKKVLIISYYWPPSGGGGVMRWLKMSKYLPGFGWQPIIYTPQNPDPSVFDFSLAEEVHPEIMELKIPIWEPYYIYRKITGKGENTTFKAGYISEASTGQSLKGKISVFIRGNFLIPDPRKFWIRPSVKYLSKFLKKNNIDLIISTGPPHSMHVIALRLKKKFNIPWIADFRDPWTDIDFYEKLRLTKWADGRHKKQEKEVLTYADHVVTVSPGCASDLEKKNNRRVEVIYNGFDPHDYNFHKPEPDKSFSITHFGALNKDRNPVSLWKAMRELSEESGHFNKALVIQLIGQTDKTVIEEIKKNGLYKNLVLIKHLPHKEGLKKLSTSQLLLLPINDAPNANGILPGKMYEYLAIKRPILAIGPANADFNQIIKETNSGIVHTFDDVSGIKKTLSGYFDLFEKNKLVVRSDSYEKFSRKNLARQFIELASQSIH